MIIKYLLLLLLSFTFNCYAQSARELASEEKFNIIFILTDDQGWTDSSLQMSVHIVESKSDYYETPNLERLAANGVRFSNAYSPSPICSPTRISLLTGKSPQQLHLTDIIDAQPGSKRHVDYYVGMPQLVPISLPGIEKSEVTIAELIKQQIPEYITAHFGKWHLAGGGPGQHGFDYHDGSSGNGTTGGALNPPPNPKDVFGITDRAIEFMQKSVADERPFFLQISHYAPHLPPIGTQDTIKKYVQKPKGERHKNPAYAAMIEHLDSSIGLLFTAIEKMNITDKTYIFFMSDNGGSKQGVRNPMTDNYPLAHGKASVWEGGIRVPMIVSGPGISHGKSIDTPVIGWDFFPTFCEITGCSIEKLSGLEGGSLLDILQGKNNVVERPRNDALFWYFPHYLSISGIAPQAAVRQGPHKLIKFFGDNSVKLFNLEKDIGESVDISGDKKILARELESMLDNYLADINAMLPSSIRKSDDLNTFNETIIIEFQENNSITTDLDGKYSSIYQGLEHAFPEGWIVHEEGFMNYFASTSDQFPWNDIHNTGTYYGVGSLSVFLTPEDKVKNHIRPLSEFAGSTIDTLIGQGVINNKVPVYKLNIDGRDTVFFYTNFGDREILYLYIQLAEDRIALVTANGLRSEHDNMESISLAVARSLIPLSNPQIRPL